MVRRPIALPFAVLLLAVGPSCSSSQSTPSKGAVPFEVGSPWPKFRGNAVQDALSSVHPKTTGGALWDFKTARGIFSSPVISADGTIYIGSADRTFYAIAKDGSLRFSVPTGEIIDSSALLDDRGRVYFGSGDGKLRALDAKTGASVWTMQADDPSVNKAFINWFEGNVAMGPSGRLYAGNDNFSVYALDRDDGSVAWSYRMPDQTWSLPAIDVATETLFIGNNNLLPVLGKNTYGIDRNGSANWSAVSPGSVAASPLLTSDGAMVVGGFDGYVRAYDAESGDVRWQFATRDHVYASPARLPDGTIVEPSSDGTLYAIDPKTGAARWAFDANEPIRSSPAVDADGNVYFGGGDGRLYVVKADGTLRWSMKLIDGDRNDLNSSPALGEDAIVLGGESGQIFSVPYEYCLRPEGIADARCATTPAVTLPPNDASLLFTTHFGSLTGDMPPSIDANDAITLSLVVRANGTTIPALLDSTSLAVTIDPPADVDVKVSGDAKFITIAPRAGFVAAADGSVTITVHDKYLVDMDRAGLRMSGGTVGGDVTRTLRATLLDKGTRAFDPSGVWEVSRLAIPLPTLMPSYNQIGFDSLHYLLGVVESDDTHGVGWMVGGKLNEGDPRAVVDPQTKGLFPLEILIQGGLVTLQNQDGLRVQVMSFEMPFQSFRISTHLDASGNAISAASLSGSAVCGGIPFYGPFLQTLGLCNPQTDAITIFGGANFTRYGAATSPAGVGTVTFAATADAITATLTGSTLVAGDHVTSLLVVDAATGKPVTLGYALESTRTTSATGALASVGIPIKGHTLPKNVRVYLMVDTAAAAKGALALP